MVVFWRNKIASTKPEDVVLYVVILVTTDQIVSIFIFIIRTHKLICPFATHRKTKLAQFAPEYQQLRRKRRALIGCPLYLLVLSDDYNKLQQCETAILKTNNYVSAAQKTLNMFREKRIYSIVFTSVEYPLIVSHHRVSKQWWQW